MLKIDEKDLEFFKINWNETNVILSEDVIRDLKKENMFVKFVEKNSGLKTIIIYIN